MGLLGKGLWDERGVEFYSLHSFMLFRMVLCYRLLCVFGVSHLRWLPSV